MTKQVSKSQFKARALQFFREVEVDGTPILITDRGEPKLEIRRVRVGSRSPFEILRGSVLSYERPFDPAVNEEEWEALR